MRNHVWPGFERLPYSRSPLVFPRVNKDQARRPWVSHRQPPPGAGWCRVGNVIAAFDDKRPLINDT